MTHICLCVMNHLEFENEKVFSNQNQNSKLEQTQTQSLRVFY